VLWNLFEFGCNSQRKSTLRKNTLLTVAASVAVAAVVLAASPAQAALFNEVAFINVDGGTNKTDGLLIAVANGQLQIGRDGDGQLFPDDTLPDSEWGGVSGGDSEAPMSNFFAVSFDESGIHRSPGTPDVDEPWSRASAIGNESESTSTTDYDPHVWDTFQSSSTLSADGKSGTVVNTLSATYRHCPIFNVSMEECFAPGDVEYEVVLVATFDYTYPDQFVTVTTDLTLPTGWPMENTRLSWYTDSTLGSEDDGNQFSGTLADGATVAGVVDPETNLIEAVREIPGNPINFYAGNYECPIEDNGADCAPSSDGLWVAENAAFPNEVSTEEDVDNGFGAQRASTYEVGTTSHSFDLLFVDCVEGVESAVACADQGIARTADVVVEDPATLAATGVDQGATSGLVAGGVALLALGALVIARRVRRSNAS
jgi:LPXTG-motif cell wall-anchored protein